jgi:hypothetical protein
MSVATGSLQLLQITVSVLHELTKAVAVFIFQQKCQGGSFSVQTLVSRRPSQKLIFIRRVIKQASQPRGKEVNKDHAHPHLSKEQTPHHVYTVEHRTNTSPLLQS